MLSASVLLHVCLTMGLNVDLGIHKQGDMVDKSQAGFVIMRETMSNAKASVTCNNDYVVTGCGIKQEDLTTSSPMENWEAWPDKSDSQTCNCRGSAGGICLAYCIKRWTLSEYQQLYVNFSGSIKLNCSSSHTVVGCGMRDNRIQKQRTYGKTTKYNIDKFKQIYPFVDDGDSGCYCKNNFNATCFAICATNLVNTRIYSKTGTTGNNRIDSVGVGCDGNESFALSCGLSRPDDEQDNQANLFLSYYQQKNYNLSCFASAVDINSTEVSTTLSSFVLCTNLFVPTSYTFITQLILGIGIIGAVAVGLLCIYKNCDFFVRVRQKLKQQRPSRFKHSLMPKEKYKWEWETYPCVTNMFEMNDGRYNWKHKNLILYILIFSCFSVIWSIFSILWLNLYGNNWSDDSEHRYKFLALVFMLSMYDIPIIIESLVLIGCENRKYDALTYHQSGSKLYSMLQANNGIKYIAIVLFSLIWMCLVSNNDAITTDIKYIIAIWFSWMVLWLVMGTLFVYLLNEYFSMFFVNFIKPNLDTKHELIRTTKELEWQKYSRNHFSHFLHPNTAYFLQTNTTSINGFWRKVYSNHIIIVYLIKCLLIMTLCIAPVWILVEQDLIVLVLVSLAFAGIEIGDLALFDHYLKKIDQFYHNQQDFMKYHEYVIKLQHFVSIQFYCLVWFGIWICYCSLLTSYSESWTQHDGLFVLGNFGSAGKMICFDGAVIGTCTSAHYCLVQLQLQISRKCYNAWRNRLSTKVDDFEKKSYWFNHFYHMDAHTVNRIVNKEKDSNDNINNNITNNNNINHSYSRSDHRFSSHRFSYHQLVRVHKDRGIDKHMDPNCLMEKLKQHEKDGKKCIMVDISNLKYINDRFGHEAGDSIIDETRKRIMQAQYMLIPDDFDSPTTLKSYKSYLDYMYEWNSNTRRVGSSAHIVLPDSSNDIEVDNLVDKIEQVLEMTMPYVKWSVECRDCHEFRIDAQDKIAKTDGNDQLQKKMQFDRDAVMYDLMRYDELVSRGCYKDNCGAFIAIDIDGMGSINKRLGKYNDQDVVNVTSNGIIEDLFDILNGSVEQIQMSHADDHKTNNISPNTNVRSKLLSFSGAVHEVRPTESRCYCVHRSGDEFVIKVPNVKLAYRVCKKIDENLRHACGIRSGNNDNNNNICSPYHANINQEIHGKYMHISKLAKDLQHEITITMAIGGSVKIADETLIAAKKAQKRAKKVRRSRIIDSSAQHRTVSVFTNSSLNASMFTNTNSHVTHVPTPRHTLDETDDEKSKDDSGCDDEEKEISWMQMSDNCEQWDKRENTIVANVGLSWKDLPILILDSIRKYIKDHDEPKWKIVKNECEIQQIVSNEQLRKNRIISVMASGLCSVVLVAILSVLFAVFIQLLKELSFRHVLVLNALAGIVMVIIYFTWNQRIDQSNGVKQSQDRIQAAIPMPWDFVLFPMLSDVPKWQYKRRY